MGIRKKKRKGVTAMKRTSFIILALTFTLSVILSASVSFAEEHYGEDVQDLSLIHI